MPTATKYFDRPVTNFGPLTTTFTAASSCATPSHSNLLWYYHPKDSSGSLAGASGGKCYGSFKWDDCIPSASSYEDTINTVYPEGYLPYFSPGIHCPSGWTTAGTVAGSAAKPTGGLHATPSGASGIFTQDPWPFNSTEDSDSDSGYNAGAYMPVIKAYLGILEEDETMAWCCPSSYTVDINGGCLSTVRPAATSDDLGVCALSLGAGPSGLITTYDGQTFDPPLISWPTFSGTPSTEVITIVPSGTQDVYLVSEVPALALIHKSGDKGSEATATGTEATTASSTGSATGPASGSASGSSTGKDDDKDSGSLGRQSSSKLGLAMAALTASALLLVA